MMSFKIILLCLLIAVPAEAAELFSCEHVVSEDNANPILKKDAHVDLFIDGATVLSRVTVPVSSKDITFKECSALSPTGADDFSRWFEYVCKKMNSFDELPFSVDASFSGSYAAISRNLTPKDSMWDVLLKSSKTLGIKMPDRTFVIYNDRHPVFEFFCRRDDTFQDNGKTPDMFKLPTIKKSSNP